MDKNLTQSLKDRLSEISKLKVNSNKTLVFTVGNTRVFQDSDFYLTPIRILDNIVITGIVLFSEIEGSKVFKIIDGLVDFIFVDCEKKSKNRKEGLFNLERLSTELIKHSKLKFYKGNDITTDSIDYFIFSYFKLNNELIGGKNILIVGIGNIGFKIALKLVERGANIYLKSRSKAKLSVFKNTLNLIKPNETISEVHLHDEESKINYDTVILTHLKPLNSNDFIFNKIRNSSFVLDVGKGCLNNKQIKILKSKGINAFRLNIGDVFINYILVNIKADYSFNIPRRKVLKKGVTLIEPGIIGDKNEIIVNSIDSPNIVYGVCDGFGGLKYDNDINEIKKIIKDE
tara:strand:- start:81 stop:1112 length:1032 start_codon:yes stop_codon:yes gene_type:complete